MKKAQVVEELVKLGEQFCGTVVKEVAVLRQKATMTIVHGTDVSDRWIEFDGSQVKVKKPLTDDETKHVRFSSAWFKPGLVHSTTLAALSGIKWDSSRERLLRLAFEAKIIDDATHDRLRNEHYDAQAKRDAERSMEKATSYTKSVTEMAIHAPDCEGWSIEAYDVEIDRQTQCLAALARGRHAHTFTRHEKGEYMKLLAMNIYNLIDMSKEVV